MQTHRRGHLVYAARGVLSVHTERGTSIVPANRVAWTPAGCTHRHRAHSDTDMRIVFLPASLARLAPDHPAVLLVSGLAREVLLALTGPREYDPAARARLQRVLVDELREAGEQPLQLPEPRDDRLQAIARMLRDDPANNASLADLGQAAGASGRTLSRLFRDELGMTFYEWRTQLRIYHALVLLADGHDATRVAHACGWANPSSFITAFTSIVGITPGRYRASPEGFPGRHRRPGGGPRVPARRRGSLLSIPRDTAGGLDGEKVDTISIGKLESRDRSAWQELFAGYQDLLTAPAARGKGVARALIAEVERWASEQACTRVYWLTQSSNETARRRYDQVAENRGFIQYAIEL